ncbi:MAG: thiamine diphosphokinase [Aggregatilineales bacterium]
MQKALIFANGDADDGTMVQRVLSDAEHAHIIAADGGTRMAAFYGFDVDIVIGDMDSLSEHELKHLEARNVTLERYPPAKNETDLELALIWAASHQYNWIRIIGGRGSRFDQEIANVYLLTLPALAECDVALAAGKQSIHVLRPGTYTITGNINDTISLIPIKGDVLHISTQGLRYPLNDETLQFGFARGVSNVLSAASAQVSFEQGLLLLVHTIGQAE